jgi:hypothetical protein
MYPPLKTTQSVFGNLFQSEDVQEMVTCPIVGHARVMVTSQLIGVVRTEYLGTCDVCHRA